MKNLLAACLLLASLSASAQTWTRYAQTDDATIYFDHLRTRKIGDVAFVWDLHDLSAPLTQADGKPFRSALYAVEYNCRAKKRRMLSGLRHAENMGKGSVTAEEIQVSEWSEVKPDSLASALFDRVCE